MLLVKKTSVFKSSDGFDVCLLLFTTKLKQHFHLDFGKKKSFSELIVYTIRSSVIDFIIIFEWNQMENNLFDNDVFI